MDIVLRAAAAYDRVAWEIPEKTGQVSFIEKQ